VERHTPAVRREEILAATVEQISALGLAQVRVADVAKSLGVSNGLVFYHFDTKDRLVAEAFAYAAQRDLEALARILDEPGSAHDRLVRVIRHYVPSASTQGWPLWIDGWAAALRSEEVREVSRGLDARWKEGVSRLIEEGVRAGEFRCENPQDAAWRITSLVDGLAVQLVANRGPITRRQITEWVLSYADAQVGVPAVGHI